MLDSNWNKYSNKVRFTFNSGVVYEGVGTDEVLQVDIQRDLADNNTDPLGVVRSGTISIKLMDKDKKFVKNNKTSPYFGLLSEGFKIEWYISIDGGVFTKHGEYYATDIKNSSGNGGYNKVTINGADILQYIGNQPVNIVGIRRNQTVKDYLASIFNSVGLNASQYNIADTLTKTIKYTYTFGTKLKDVLNSVAKSYMCNIFVDGNGIIQVVDLLDLANKTTKRMDFDGVVNTFEVALGTDLLDTYNAVRLKYTNPTVVKGDTLLEISDFEIPAGTNELSEFTFSNNKKADKIEYVTIVPVESDVTISINNIRWTQDSIILNVTNPKETAIRAKIVVKGDCLIENTAVMERYISGIPVERRKYIEIDAKLIQSDSYAEEYCTIILHYLSADVSYLTLRTKGHPLLELADIVGVKSGLVDFDGTCILSSIKLSLGVSSTCNISVLNSAALRIE